MDSTNGSPVDGAHLTIGNVVYDSDSDGVVTVERPGNNVEIRVEADGFFTVVGTFDRSMASSQSVLLRPDPDWPEKPELEAAVRT